MAAHAKYALRCPCISEVLDLPLAVPASETRCTEGLIACEDSQILNLVTAGAAAICTVVADERAITEEEEVRIGVEEGSAGITSEAVQVPSIASCRSVSYAVARRWGWASWWRENISRARVDTSQRREMRGGQHHQLTKFEGFSLLEDLVSQLVLRATQISCGGPRTSPHPLHGYAISSPSMGESRYSAGDSIVGVAESQPSRRRKVGGRDHLAVALCTLVGSSSTRLPPL